MRVTAEPKESYVERLWNNLVNLQQNIPKKDATILVDTRSAFAKTMSLAAGNWLERRTIDVLVDFVTRASGSTQTLVSFVDTGVLD